MRISLLCILICVAVTPSQVSRLGFGSCLFQGESMQILAVIQRFDPAIFVFLGDNVYGSFTSKQWPLWRAYRRQRMNLEAIGWNIPSLRIWDDGDLGENDGGADFVHLSKSRELFLENWQIDANDPRRYQNALYMEQRLRNLGIDVQILILDVRSQRSAWKRNPKQQLLKRYLKDDSDSKTMLGAEQWNWLRSRITETVDLRIIVSPIQILAEGHHWECWNLFPNERMRLLKALDTASARNTLLVSGDRHRGAFYRLSMPETGTQFLEVTASSLNRKAERRTEPGPNRITDLYCDENFAMLEIKDSKVSIGLYDLQGKLIGQQLPLGLNRKSS